MGQTQQTLAEFRADQLQQAILDVARRMRRLADEVEQAAAQVAKIGTGGTYAYGPIGSEVIHTVQWGIANARLERVTLYAAEADQARTQAQTADGIADTVTETVGGYPDNGVERPKAERGQHLNDVEWAVQIARSRRE